MKVKILPKGQREIIVDLNTKVLTGAGYREKTGGIIQLVGDEGEHILTLFIDKGGEIDLVLNEYTFPVSQLNIPGYKTEIIHEKAAPPGIIERLHDWNQLEVLVGTDFVHASLDHDGNGSIHEENRELAAFISEAESDGVKLLRVIDDQE